ncbi:MAG: M23 family metallopeptidase, partial [Clostridia bacterium]|nr:M23 family metallopeptidase [Clostridia bacterium]
MEIKKNKKQTKNIYIPLLLVLVVIAGIVAVSTTVRDAKEDAARRASAADTKSDIPVVASPSDKDKDKDDIPPYQNKIEESVKDAASDNETVESENPEQTEDAAAEAEKAPTVPVFISPVGGVVSKVFSDTVPVFSNTMNDYRVHTGVDVTGADGEAVLASANGTIGAIWDDPLMGKCMTVVHDGEFVSTYKGLAELLPAGIAQGVEVSAGQPIGAIGDTALIEVAE